MSSEEDSNVPSSFEYLEKLGIRCELCQKSFSGLIPYSQHMRSGQHAKRKITERMFHQYVTGTTRCGLCNQTFTDELSYSEHIQSIPHIERRFEENERFLCIKSSSDSDDKASFQYLGESSSSALMNPVVGSTSLGKKGCSVCGIESFTSTAALIAHLESNDHTIKKWMSMTAKSPHIEHQDDSN